MSPAVFVNLNKMKVIINRTENDIAVLELENGKIVNAPLCIFENGAEGDVFNIIADKCETAALKEKNAAKLKNLFNKTT